MKKISMGSQNFIALDIGTTAIRIVELKGATKPKALVRYASVPVDSKLVLSDSKEDMKKLITAVGNAIKEQGFTQKNVVIGVPSSKVFVTIVDFPKLQKGELEKTIKYQLDSHIPMSIDDVKVDWAVLGDSPAGDDKIEVLIASVSNSYAEARLDLLEQIGLNVIAIEPDALALARSLMNDTVTAPVLLLDIGEQATDIVMTYQNSPRLVRSVPTGVGTFTQLAAQNLNIDASKAHEFVFKFGMTTDKLEGQVAKALTSSVDSLVSEVQKSIKFFTARYKVDAIDRIIVSGRAANIPSLPLYIANKTGVQVEIGNPWQNVQYPQSQYNQISEVANRFSVAIGLGLRDE